MKRKLIGTALALILTAGLFTGCGSTGQKPADGGQAKKLDYPKKAITVVVGWGAGGGTDVFARAIAQPASEMMKQPVNVVNMNGASGAVSGDYVTRQPADGYTIWAEGSNYAINVALGKTPHDLSKYIPIARIQYDTGTLQVAKNSQFKTIDELVTYAKANPGKITVGGTGAAGFDEVVVAKFEKAAGIDLKYVPFENAGEMRSALLGGHIDVEYEEFGPTVKLIQDGSIRVLVAFTEKKLDQYPNVPASKEKGWDVTDGIWRGIFVREGTSKEIVDYLRDVFKKSKDSASYKEIEKKNVLDLRPGYMDADEFKAFVQKDIEAYKTILKDLGYIK